MDIKQWPKSQQKLKEFTKKYLMAFQKNVMKDAPTDILEIPEITEEMAEKFIPAMLMTQKRNLYDFFSENNIEIELGVDRTMEPKFCYSFGDDNSDLFYTRLEAEDEAFKAAFKLLEEKS